MSANEEIWPTQPDARYTGGDRERGDYLALEHIPHLVVVLILMINVISTTCGYDDYMDVDDCEYYYGACVMYVHSSISEVKITLILSFGCGWYGSSCTISLSNPVWRLHGK